MAAVRFEQVQKYFGAKGTLNLHLYGHGHTHTFSFKNFVDDILCSWNSYHGQFLYTVKYSSLQTYLLKNCHPSSLLVPFSAPLVLVAFSLVGAIRWWSQSQDHSLQLGIIGIIFLMASSFVGCCWKVVNVYGWSGLLTFTPLLYS